MPDPPRFLLCERTGYWTAAIRWQQNARPLPLQEIRSLIDLRASLLQSPASIAAIEVTPANAEGVLRLLLEIRQLHPGARVIVMLTSEVLSLAEIYLEVGAALVVLSMRRLDRVVRLVEFHLASQELPNTTTRERVWARLPWQRD
jgi:hypothetical protein